MIERLQMYNCERCNGMVAVLRGGAGELTCCSQPMNLYQENAPGAAQKRRTMVESAMGKKVPICNCEECGSMVVVLHKSAGPLTCCGQEMNLLKEDALDGSQDEAAHLKVPSMEHNLSMPLKTVLKIMQQRQLTTTYFGINAQKNPLDFWVYQEIIFEIKPDVIVEIGNAYGGATLALAHLLDHMHKGRVIGLDIQHETIAPIVREHPRITLITGDACGSFGKVKALIEKNDTVLIIEDSSHTYQNTLNVLRTFSPLVTPGSYFIVEDSNCHHGVDIGPSPGPYEAIEQFIKENRDFQVDRTMESFFITWNPMGYLKKTK